MSDWADEKAASLMDWHWHAGNRVSSANQGEIAAALRKAREDALDAAADLARHEYYSRSASGVEIAAAIRALKEKT